MNKYYIRKRKADSIIICIELVSYIPDSKAVQVSLSFVEDFNSLNCSCKQLHFSILNGIYWFYLVSNQRRKLRLDLEEVDHYLVP